MQPAKILPWVQFPAGKHIFKTSTKKNGIQKRQLVQKKKTFFSRIVYTKACVLSAINSELIIAYNKKIYIFLLWNRAWPVFGIRNNHILFVTHI